MSKNYIIVVGSCMIDFITYSKSLPKPGETLTGEKFEQGFGGKGANQCVTASRLGASVSFICSLGADKYGQEYIQKLKDENIDTSLIKVNNAIHSGIAQIAVAESGENTIVIIPAANKLLSPKILHAGKNIIQNASVLVCQFEIPQETVLEALKIYKGTNGISIVNAAPAIDVIEPEIFKLCDIFCVNEIEAQHFTGIEHLDLNNAQEALDKLLSFGCKTVIITFGRHGTVHATNTNKKLIHTPVDEVEAVDTTGAGDAFIGALAYFILHYPHLRLEEHILRSTKVATKSVLKAGTQSSYPYKKELEETLFA